MAEWKKIITSGSQAELAGVTGSLSGSGAGITNVKTANLSGTITNDQLAGSIANGKLANSTISGVALGSNLNNLTVDNSSIQLDSGNDYNGSAAKTISVKDAGITPAMVSSGLSTSISGSFTADSASFSTRITAAEANDGDITRVNITAGNGLGGTQDTTEGEHTQTLSVNAAQTTIQSIKKDDLVIGRSTADDLITFSSGDISLGIGGTEVLGVDSTGVVVTGNLTVNGTTTTVNTTNTEVSDKFIFLASGSTNSTTDGGIIVSHGGGQSGSAFVYDASENRWGFPLSGSTGKTDITVSPEAYVSSVVTDDNEPTFRKDGNIRIDGGEIFIYVE